MDPDVKVSFIWFDMQWSSFVFEGTSLVIGLGKNQDLHTATVWLETESVQYSTTVSLTIFLPR